MEDNLCWLPCNSDSALEVDGMRPQPEMAKFVKGVMECLGENQRKMTKFFEDEMSGLVPFLKPLTASTKPVGEPGKETEAAAPTSANIHCSSWLFPCVRWWYSEVDGKC